MRILAKDILGRILVGLGIHKRLLRGRAIVVAFHSITKERSDGALRCSVEDFEAYCRFFARHMSTVPLTQVVQQLDSASDLNGELSITFDDGYADNAELALDVLNRWRLHATFFVTTGFVGSETQAPWDASANLRSRWMTWDQVRQLIAAGHDVGAHTVTHINLATATPEEAEEELRRSRDDLIERAGQKPAHFAVPFGRAYPSLDSTKELVRRLGFRSLSLCRGGVVPEKSSALQIERWPINPPCYLSPYGWLFDVVREPVAPVSA